MQLATNGHALGHSSTLCIKQWNVWMIACCCCGTLQDLKEAKAHYNKLVERLISNGTTTALVFGSLHLEPTKLLADILHQVVPNLSVFDNSRECLGMTYEHVKEAMSQQYQFRVCRERKFDAQLRIATATEVGDLHFVQSCMPKACAGGNARLCRQGMHGPQLQELLCAIHGAEPAGHRSLCGAHQVTHK